MRLLKAFLFGVVGLFVIITLFSLLIPSRVMVSRAVLIHGENLSDIYTQVSNFKNWQNWHPLFTIDSSKVLPNENGKPKASFLTLTHRDKKIKLDLQAADSTSIKFLMQPEDENIVQNDIVIAAAKEPNAYQVEWRAVTKLHWYPWEKFYGIFIDRLTGFSYEQALDGLKNYLDKQ